MIASDLGFNSGPDRNEFPDAVVTIDDFRRACAARDPEVDYGFVDQRRRPYTL